MKKVLFLASIFLLSCSTPKKVLTQNILGKWKVTDIQNVTLIKDADAFFNFQMEEKLSGNTSCNNYFGSFKVNGRQLSITKSGATKKLCFGKLNNYEFLFFESIGKVNSFEVERNFLTLFDQEGKVLFKANRN
ncbi:META domain-containing protein [Halobacteriovorax sp.]|uniref:META domain-containing protein n=1 Tax=Halobacteriovorax sp. TaxID=2020862 RepID=UPI003564203B